MTTDPANKGAYVLHEAICDGCVSTHEDAAMHEDLNLKPAPGRLTWLRYEPDNDGGDRG